jgi:ABC-type transport system involved in multi-copper enzyme maturation permease subunit
MKFIGILSAITVKEGFRNKVMMGILFFALVMCGLNFIITTSFTRDLGKVAVDVGLSTMSASGLAIIFFLGMPLMSKDLDKLTVYMVLARPIPRSYYILGKFIGLSSLILVSGAILGVITGLTVKIIMAMNPAYIPELFSWKIFCYSTILLLFALFIMTSLSILFTCVSSSPFIAFVLTAGTYLIGNNIELVKTFLTQSNPGGGMLIKVMNVVSWIFPNLSAFDRKTVAAYGLSLHLKEVLITCSYGFMYILCILFITIFVFNKRELT